jgi:hypothetical protein
MKNVKQIEAFPDLMAKKRKTNPSGVKQQER